MNFSGTPKITFGRPGGPDPEYASKLKSAEQQARFLDLGIGAVGQEGAGRTFVRSSQDPKYGNINNTVGDVIEGSDSNFSQEDTPFNAPLDNTTHQTGSIRNENSQTTDPQNSPDELDFSGLERKLDFYRNAADRQGGLNPSSIYDI